MPSPSTFALFAVAAVALLVIPGPAVLYVVTRSIQQGRAAGLISVLGIHGGTLVHVAAAAAGVSAILMTSAVAFTTVKLLGAGYLIYLGIAKIMSRERLDDPSGRLPDPLARIFVEGVMVNVLNPKTALFFFSFLPQFVDPARGRIAMQAVVLGLAFVVLGMLSDGIYALLGARIGSWLRRRRAFAARQHLYAGGVYLSLGVVAAVSGSRTATK